MRVGIDFHVFDGKFQGSRTHVIELFASLIDLSPDIDFYLFLQEVDLLRNMRPVFSAPNVHLVSMPAGNPFKRLMWQLPALQRRYSLDLLHTQYILPIPSACPCMVTIHDILFETHPEYFEPFFRLRSKILMRYAAKNAQHVFTVSEFSREALIQQYSVPSHDISVTYNGVDRSRFYPGNDGAEIVERRGLASGNYILTVGRLEPRKNHVTLLQAYAELGNAAPPLVIVGQRDFGFDGVFRMIESLGLKNRVIWFDDLTDDELPAIYRHARLFVYPAFAEGFGMPPAEAMAAGVPVITSDTTALPEVAGEAGLAISPNDYVALASAMKKVLSDSIVAEHMRNSGLTRAKLFSWRTSAMRVREQYLAFSRSIRVSE